MPIHVAFSPEILLLFRLAAVEIRATGFLFAREKRREKSAIRPAVWLINIKMLEPVKSAVYIYYGRYADERGEGL